MPESMQKWKLTTERMLMAKADIASLCAFRMLFGFIMALALLRFALRGWVHTQWTSASFHFAFPHLSFVTAGSAQVMHAALAFLILCALCIAFGIYTRLSAACFALGFTYLELLDQTNYLNHYYLISLLAFLLCVLPSDRSLSVDVWRQPALQVERIPRIFLLTVQAQVAVVYVFAGIAKLNADWLFEAQPMRIWLAARSDLPWFGAFLAEPWLAYVASWLGALFDLSVVPLLFYSKTRRWAFAVALSFHALTGLLFSIGVFPWLMSACLTLFLEPGWPRSLGFSRVSQGPERAARVSPWLVSLLLIHVLVQAAVPIYQYRHADSAWTYHGFNFAWRVMVAEKTGSVTFRVEDRQSGHQQRIDAEGLVTPQQARTLVQDPELIAELARHIADERRRAGHWVRVYADAFASLNGRPTQRLVDPAVDLADSPNIPFILPLISHRRR